MEISKELLSPLKDCLWWIACSSSPFIVKGTVHKNEYYLREKLILFVSVLTIREKVCEHFDNKAKSLHNNRLALKKEFWFAKGTEEQIVKEKNKYIKSIETSDFKGICQILDSQIGKSNKNANYTFAKQEPQGKLNFKIVTLLEIFPFRWDFSLEKLNSALSKDLLLSDIFNPMINALKSMELRCEIFKKRCCELEADLIKRMSERERFLIKTTIEDDENLWKNMICPAEAGEQLSEMNLSSAANYFLIQNGKKLRREEPKPIDQKGKSTKSKNLKRKASEEEDIGKTQSEKRIKNLRILNEFDFINEEALNNAESNQSLENQDKKEKRCAKKYKIDFV